MPIQLGNSLSPAEVRHLVRTHPSRRQRESAAKSRQRSAGDLPGDRP
jgi:hypothetical protein